MKRSAFILLLLLPLLPVRAQEAVKDTFDCGERVQIAATPLPGYRFVSWSDGDTARVRWVDVDGPIELTAHFEVECTDGIVPVVIINDWIAAVNRRELMDEGLIDESFPEDKVRWYRQGADQPVANGFTLMIGTTDHLNNYYVEVDIDEQTAKKNFFCSPTMRGYPYPPTDLEPVTGNMLPIKYIENEIIIIERNGRRYTATGQLLKNEE